VKYSYTTNYRILLYGIILLILIIVSYYLIRSPVIATKDCRIMGKKIDGISNLKVKLHIKNRSARTISNIKIIDKVPSLVDIVEENNLGSLRPTKILRHGNSGVIARWDLEALEPYEERIITYKLKSKLKIFGSIELPQTLMKFDSKFGGIRTSTSNSIEIIESKHKHKME
jgi:hypothetical protein